MAFNIELISAEGLEIPVLEREKKIIRDLNPYENIKESEEKRLEKGQRSINFLKICKIIKEFNPFETSKDREQYIKECDELFTIDEETRREYPKTEPKVYGLKNFMSPEEFESYNKKLAEFIARSETLGKKLMESLRVKTDGSSLRLAARLNSYNTAQFALILYRTLSSDFAVMSKDVLGETALMHACEAGNFEKAKILLNHLAIRDLAKTAVMDVDNDFQTPLMKACAHCQDLRLIELLLESGSSLKTEDNEGLTALDYAKRNPNKLVAELISNKLRRPLDILDEAGMYDKPELRIGPAFDLFKRKLGLKPTDIVEGITQEKDTIKINISSHGMSFWYDLKTLYDVNQAELEDLEKEKSAIAFPDVTSSSSSGSRPKLTQ